MIAGKFRMAPTLNAIREVRCRELGPDCISCRDLYYRIFTGALEWLEEFSTRYEYDKTYREFRDEMCPW